MASLKEQINALPVGFEALRPLLENILTDLKAVRAAGTVADVTAVRAEVVKLVTDITAVRAPLAGLISGSIVWDPASLLDGAGETSASITATGAALGDLVLVSAPYDLVGITVTGYVDAANSAKIRIQNESGVTVDLVSGTWRVRVLPQATFIAPAAITAANPAAITGTAAGALTLTE